MATSRPTPSVGLDAAIAAVPELGHGARHPGRHPRRDHRRVDRPVQEASGLGAISSRRLGGLDRRTCATLDLVPNAGDGRAAVDTSLLPGDLARALDSGHAGWHPAELAQRRSWWLREALAAEAADGAAPRRGRARRHRCAGRRPPTSSSSVAGTPGCGPPSALTELEPARPDRPARGRHLRRRTVRAQRRVRHELVGRAGDARRALRRRRGAGDGRRRWRPRSTSSGRGARPTASMPGSPRPARSGVSAAPAQDGAWDDGVAACRRLGVADRYVPLDAGAGRRAGPLPGPARRRVHARRGDHPAGHPGARPASGPARARRAHPRGHDGRRRSTASGRAGWAGSARRSRQAPARRGSAAGRRAVRVRTTSADGRRRGPRLPARSSRSTRGRPAGRGSGAGSSPGRRT